MKSLLSPSPTQTTDQLPNDPLADVQLCLDLSRFSVRVVEDLFDPPPGWPAEHHQRDYVEVPDPSQEHVSRQKHDQEDGAPKRLPTL